MLNHSIGAELTDFLSGILRCYILVRFDGKCTIGVCRMNIACNAWTTARFSQMGGYTIVECRFSRRVSLQLFDIEICSSWSNIGYLHTNSSQLWRMQLTRSRNGIAYNIPCTYTDSSWSLTINHSTLRYVFFVYSSISGLVITKQIRLVNSISRDRWKEIDQSSKSHISCKLHITDNKCCWSNRPLAHITCLFVNIQ